MLQREMIPSLSVIKILSVVTLKATFNTWLFSRQGLSNSLHPHGLQHSRLLCPLSPRVCSNSRPLSQWCHLTILSSAAPFSFCHQSFPASESTINKLDNLTIWHRKLYSIFGSNLYGKSIWERMNICVTESLCCAPEINTMCACLVPESCPALCDPKHSSPSGSSVHGILQTRTLEWMPCPPPEDLSNLGIEPASLALAGRLFTTSTTWKALN